MYKEKVLIFTIVLVLLISPISSFAVEGYPVEDMERYGDVELHRTQKIDEIKNSLKYLGLDELNLSSSEKVELLVISQLESDISDKLFKAGATKVNRFTEGAYKIMIPAKRAFNIANISELVAVGPNTEIKLDPVQRVPIAYPNLEYSNEETSINDLWEKGYDGKDTIIGIIDTGVEVDHELLKVTPDGKLKIMDYQSFLHAGFYSDEPAENDIKVVELNITSENLKIPYQYLEKDEYGQYIVKNGEAEVKVSQKYVGKKSLAGVFSELKLMTDDGGFFDTNNNNRSDRFPLLCVDTTNDGQYDSMIFDTNLDNDLTDEKEIGIYKEVAKEIKDEVIFDMTGEEPVVKEEFESSYDRLFNTIENKITYSEDIRSETKFNFVCTRIDNETLGSWYVNIAFDTNGHGTHVAGDAAANGYMEHEFVDKSVEPSGKLIGPAKGAQVMALKVFGSRGGTQDEMYVRAMQYAAINGADIVNLSLGSQPEITNGTSIGAQYADLLTIKYGTLFVISNGNNGPGLNSNGSPGDSWFALAVGAYCPNFEVVDSTYTEAEDQMWLFSSNGPADDGRIKPDIVAPGSMISAAPQWLITGKGYDEFGTFKDILETGKAYVGYARQQGTSMSAPYASGVAAALKQAVKKEQLNYHPLLFKEAIMKTAYSNINNGKYTPVEIGSGMINPDGALEELRKMSNSDILPKLTTGETPSYEWPYDVKDGKFKYTSYNDMYIYPNVLFKNDDRMRSSNATGIYIKDKDIPEYVEVELQNRTARDVNLNASKIAYGYGQNTDWLDVQSTIKVSQSKFTKLRINLNKDKLKDGVNIILLKLDDSDTYQMDCIIPVTVIKFDRLGFNNHGFKSNHSVAPGAYDRAFLRVGDDVDTIRITLDVTEELKEINGRIRPIIYFPNGIKYIWEDMNTFAGCQRSEENNGEFLDKIEIVISRSDLQKASDELTYTNPNRSWMWEGTWEIDLYTSIGSLGTVDSELTLSTKGVLLSENSKHIDISAGDVKEGSIDVVNTTGEDIKVRCHGLVSLDKNIEKERIIGFPEFNTFEKGFYIDNNSKNIFHRLVVTNPSYAEGARVWLYLYKAKLNSNGSYELEKPYINHYINVQKNGMESEMITYNLEPGYYVYVLFGGMMEYGPVDFDVISQVLNEEDAIEDSMNISSDRVIKDGNTATINYNLKAPVDEGKYLSRILFENSKDDVVNFYSMIADVEGTNKKLLVKQRGVPLLNDEFEVDIDGDFPEDTENNSMLYGLELELSYDVNKVEAIEVAPGQAFKEFNSYMVRNEIDEENGKVKFAYAFKGLNFDGIKKGNLAKVRFRTKKIGTAELDINNFIAGNYEGRELAVKVEKQNIVIANPDINGDEVVDMKDYAYIAYSYGATPEDVRWRSKADVNKDGVIDDIDLDYIIKYFSLEY